MYDDVITDVLFSLPRLLQATEGAKGLLLLQRALFVAIFRSIWSVCKSVVCDETDFRLMRFLTFP